MFKSKALIRRNTYHFHSLYINIHLIIHWKHNIHSNSSVKFPYLNNLQFKFPVEKNNSSQINKNLFCIFIHICLKQYIKLLNYYNAFNTGNIHLKLPINGDLII